MESSALRETMVSYSRMGVDNFFYGLQAVLIGTVDTVRVAASYPLLIGFAVGFLTASVVHSLLNADHIAHVPSMLLRDASTSFQKVHPASADGTYQHSYTDYVKNVSRMKSVFYLSGIVLIAILMSATLFFK